MLASGRHNRFFSARGVMPAPPDHGSFAFAIVRIPAERPTAAEAETK